MVKIIIDPGNGAPDGRETLSGAVEVNAAGDAFRAEGDIEVVGLDGTLRATARMEVVGTRIAARPVGTPEPGASAQGAVSQVASGDSDVGPGDHPHHFDWDPGAAAHHWCRPVAGGFFECLIYASDAPDAPLVAVEFVVEAATYEGFDPDEQRLWYPVESNYGKLILLGDRESFGVLPAGKPRVIFPY